jgi:peptidyl-prolyl cis-trans isomerase C
MRRPLVIAAMALMAATVFQGCGGKGEKTSELSPAQERKLAARVDDWTVTRDYLQKYIDQQPESQRRKYDNDEGRATLAGKMIEEELFYREAQKKDLIKEDVVQAQIKDATRRILIAAYYNDYVASEAEPSDQEMHDYYESHQDQYTSLEICRAQHIFSKNKEKLEDIKKRIVDGGEKFTTMAHLYSEDTLTKPDGGDLGYFNPGGYIRFVGFSKTFSDTVFTMEPLKVYGPIKWEKGYSLVLVLEKRPPRLKPYAEVRDKIRKILMNDRIESARMRVVQNIIDSGKYNVENYMNDEYNATQRNPEELWNLAQNAEDPTTRLATFQEIVSKFPQDSHAPQALFMVGFVYSEEMYDYPTASRTFKLLIDRYPDSEYADMARWMIDNMGKGAPKFGDINDVKGRMKESSKKESSD